MPSKYESLPRWSLVGEMHAEQNKQVKTLSLNIDECCGKRAEWGVGMRLGTLGRRVTLNPNIIQSGNTL